MCRFAGAAALSSLLNDAIALKCGEMGAHGIIGEIERLCQFIYCAAGPAQQHYNTSACAAKETLIPVRNSHRENLSLLRPLYRVWLDLSRKSIISLTFLTNYGMKLT